MRYWILILFLAFPLFLKAQQTAVSADTSQQKFVAISLSEIPSEAERLIQKINKEYSQKIAKPTIQEVQKLTDSLKSSASNLAELSNLILNQNIPYFVLETAINRWNRLGPLIEKEENKLKDYSTQLSEVNEALSESNISWLLTKEKYQEEIFPEAIENRLLEVLGIIDSVKSVLNDSLTNCLNLQNTLVDVQLNAEYYLKELNDYKTQTLSELLTTKDPPIWVIKENLDSTVLNYSINLLISYSKEDMSNYYNSEQHSIFTILVLFIIFWLALLWMKSRYNELSAKEVKELELGKYIFSRAATAAFLFAMIVQSLVLPQKPYILDLGINVTIFFLFLSLIPGMVIKPLRWSLYLLAILFLFVNFDLIIFDSQRAIRFSILITSFGVFALLGWFLLNESKIKPEDPEKSVWFNFLSFSGSIFFILTIIAIIANIIGFTYLGRLINRGIINSSLVWLLLIAAYRIIEGLTYLFLETNFALRSRIVLSRRKDILRFISFIFKNGCFLLWLYYSLGFFMLSNIVGEWLQSIWDLGFQSDNIDISVGKIVSFLLILIAGWSIANMIKVLLQIEILSRLKLSRGIPMAIASVTNYILVVIGFFLALAFAGFDLTKISFIIGTLGVGIGFGLQNLVLNFISGLILIFERPIAIGDIIIVENIEGTVTNIGIRSSTVLQYNGDEEIIPNAILISGKVTNRTLTNNQRRFTITINTALDTDPAEVINLLQKAATDVEGVLNYPEPKAYFQGIVQQSLQFSLYYWVGNDILESVSKANLKVHELLREAGIQIPIPRQIEYHVDGLTDEGLSTKTQTKKEENEKKDEQN